LTDFGGTYLDFDIQMLKLGFDVNQYKYRVISETKPRPMRESDEPIGDTTRISGNFDIQWDSFPTDIPHPTVTDDGISVACAEPAFQDRIYKIAFSNDGNNYVRWCQPECNGRTSMTDPSAYKMVFSLDVKFTDPIAYKWKGRYFNNLAACRTDAYPRIKSGDAGAWGCHSNY
jgi:hypothetical protein